MKILTYGSLNLDYVYQVSRFVQPGETLASSYMQVNCGGKGLNQSIALARAGGDVYHAGAIGSDGDMLKKTLENDNVNTELLMVLENVATGHAIIQVDAQGQNCILLFGGANQNIPLDEIEKMLEPFSEGDYLVLQNEVNGNREIMELAHKKGMRIVLNPSPMDEAVLQLPLEYVDWFLVNEVEVQELCGGDVDALLKKYPNAGVVVTLGSRGVKCYREGKIYSHGIYKVSAVDTTAAGDTFSGYFIAGIAGGQSIPEALRMASMASSIAVSRPGAQSSIPYPDDVHTHNAPYVPYTEN